MACSASLFGWCISEEIFETIDVAIEMGGGPAAAYSRFALNALDFHKKQTTN